MKTIELQMLHMVLRNLPPLETDTDQDVWEEVTADHVTTYWNGRKYSGVVVSKVTTQLVEQESVSSSSSSDSNLFNRKKYRLLQEDELIRFSYNQQITFGYLDKESSIQDDENELYFRPFQVDSQRYVDTLTDQLKLNLTSEIFLVSHEGQIVPTEAPTQVPSSPPSVAPVLPPPSVPGTDTTTVVIIIISVAIGLMIIFIVGYFSNQRRRAKELKGEHHHHQRGHRRGDMDDDETSTPDVPISHIRAPAMSAYSVDESDIDPYSVAAGSYLLSGDMNSNYGIDEADDAQYTSLSYRGGGLSNSKRSVVSSLDNDVDQPSYLGRFTGREEEDENEADVLPPVPPSHEYITSMPRPPAPQSMSYDEDDDIDDAGVGVPSMAAFDVKVIDLDD